MKRCKKIQFTGVSRASRASIGRFTKDNRGQHWTTAVTRNCFKTLGFRRKALERATRIELAFSAWEAELVLARCFVKILIGRIVQSVLLKSQFDWAPHGHYVDD